MSFDDLRIEDLRRRRGEKWQQYGPDVLGMWVADMDFPVAEPIAEMLRDTARFSDVGYPLNPTARDLPTTFSARMAERFDWEIAPTRVDVLTDVVQGMYIALDALTEPGDGAIVQTPIYPPFLKCVTELDRTLVEQPLVRGADGAYEIDFDALRAAVRPNTRALLLCNPHNPTGRVFTRAELEGLAELALANDLWIVSDEIHSDLVYTGSRHIPIATISPEVEARTVTLSSASKAFNIAGLRVAVAAHGSEALRRAFNARPRNLRGGLGTIGLAATQLAWTKCDAWLAEALRYLEANRDFTEAFLDERLPGIRHAAPEGTYLYWLDCADLGLPDRPHSFFLERARVGLSDGAAFGTGSTGGFARINFATSRAILTEGLERMAAAVADVVG